MFEISLEGQVSKLYVNVHLDPFFFNFIIIFATVDVVRLFHQKSGA